MPQSPARTARRSGRGLPSGSEPGGVATLYPKEMKKKKHSRKGKSRLRLLMAAVDVPEVPVVLEHCTTPLDGGVQAGGPAGHREMG